ncbi:hypothetical protein B4Q13_23995 [Lacticaseibacillus rhamnosus]
MLAHERRVQADRAAWVLSVGIAAVAVAASAMGLFVPALYADGAWAREARSIAFAAQNVPEAGPPLQWPPLFPGGWVYRNASTGANPVSVVGGGPSARPGD